MAGVVSGQSSSNVIGIARDAFTGFSCSLSSYTIYTGTLKSGVFGKINKSIVRFVAINFQRFVKFMAFFLTLILSMHVNFQ